MKDLLELYRTRCRALVDGSPEPAELADMIPSLGPPVLDATAVARLQDRLPFPLPEAFLEYLQGPLVESGVEWAQVTVPSNDDLGRLEVLMLRPDLWRLGLLAFATGGCGDDVCFDYLQGAGEPAVLEINHDRAPREAWEDPHLIRTYADRRWPSFRALMKDLCSDGL